jgi:hypothetical protein
VPGRAQVGDVVLADGAPPPGRVAARAPPRLIGRGRTAGCLFLDRLRTRDQNAFDWGLWGGGCTPTPRLAAALRLTRGTRPASPGQHCHFDRK